MDYGAAHLGTDFHGLGEFFVDADGVLYFCVQNGTPGTWKKVQLI